MAAYPKTQIVYKVLPANMPKISRVEAPVRDPLDNEVVIKIICCGLCHSDVGILDAPKEHYPEQGWTLGHEICGNIVAFGAKAQAAHSHLSLGTRVAVHQINPCREHDCDECSVGAENLCQRAVGKGVGIGADGGFASYITLPAAAVYLVPDSVDSPAAAIATDAMTTAYHGAALASITPQDVVLVMGLGGVGSSAVQCAKRVFKAGIVVAIDLHAPKFELARTLGADFAGKEDEVTAWLAEKKLKPTVALDCVGITPTLNTALTLLAIRGRLVTIGVGDYTYRMNALLIDCKGLVVYGSYSATWKEHLAVMEAIKDGLLTAVTETRPLDQLEQAIEDMHHGKILSRVVLTMDP